jgi:hypothetical protein
MVNFPCLSYYANKRQKCKMMLPPCSAWDKEYKPPKNSINEKTALVEPTQHKHPSKPAQHPFYRSLTAAENLSSSSLGIG